MLLLVLGLIIFLVPHSLGIFAPQWRSAKQSSLGRVPYMAIYSLVSIVGLALIAIGFGESRANPVFLWHPPAAMNHVAALLMVISFVLLAATYVPNNKIKSAVRHPMLLAVKVWAIAHLLANGRLGDILLFVAFLVWAVVLFSSSRKQERLNSVQALSYNSTGTAITVVVGLVGWAVFAVVLHVRLIGVAPFG